MDAPSAQALGALAALGSAVTWAVTSLIVRTLIPRYSAVAVSAIRSCIGGALLLAIVVVSRGPAALTTISRESLLLLAVSIVAAIAVGDVAFFESTRRLGLARGMSIAMAYPLVAAALAAAFLGEPLTPRVAIGSLLTLAGVVLIMTPRRGAEAVDASPHAGGEAEAWGWWVGVAGALLAAVAWGVSAVLMKAPLREVDAVTAQAVRLPIAGILLFATPWARGAVGQLRAGDPPALRALAALSGLTVISSVMFVTGLKYAGVAVATVLSSTAPMFAIPLGLVFLRERLGVGPIAGSAVTVAGIAVLQL